MNIYINKFRIALRDIHESVVDTIWVYARSANVMATLALAILSMVLVSTASTTQRATTVNAVSQAMLVMHVVEPRTIVSVNHNHRNRSAPHANATTTRHGDATPLADA
jgi:hypothetical protein